ncbi:MAG: CDP-alcohol phosphatidyltransferase family protein [Anaerolineae bacterium]
MTTPQDHKRVNDILLGPIERPALQWLAAHSPAWMTPDKLTAIGTAGAFLIFFSYLATRIHPGFLWLASLGFLINWYGDSLDGTLARYRKIQRPKYGFFIDHTVDAFTETLIMLGLGLSIYITFNVAALALIGYLMLSVFVYVRTFVRRRLPDLLRQAGADRGAGDPGPAQHGHVLRWRAHHQPALRPVYHLRYSHCAHCAGAVPDLRHLLLEQGARAGRHRPAAEARRIAVSAPVNLSPRTG